MDKVSVIIPLYNKGPYIERALDSVMAQTYSNFEVVVIDDGSTDEGPEIVKRYLSDTNKKIRLIRQKNSGVSVARNLGIRESTGDLIAFLDADDAWKPNFLEYIIGLRKRFTNAGAYATAYEVVYPGGKRSLPKFKEIPPPPWEGLIPNYLRSVIKGASPLWTSAVVVPRDVFKKIGNFASGNPLAEDLDMWLRIALKYSIAFTWKIGAIYHMEASGRKSATRCVFMAKERPDVATAIKVLKKDEVSPGLLDDLKEYIAYRKIKSGKMCLVVSYNRMGAKRLIASSQPVSFNLSFKKKIWYLIACLPVPATRFFFRLKQSLSGKNLR